MTGFPAQYVAAHRGASAYRPEHTLAAYQLAVELGADAIEIDVVATADGELVARHENEIGSTTDIASRPRFADRRTSKVIDGTELTGWFTEDLTLAELREVRAVERMPRTRPDNTGYDGRWAVPTLTEILDLVTATATRSARELALMVELKHPSYFAGIGLDLTGPLLAALAAAGLTDSPRVAIMGFETGVLRGLAEHTRHRIIQIVGPGHWRAPDLAAAGDERTSADLVTPAGLGEIATYAHGLGPHKSLILGPGPGPGTPTGVAAVARELGLSVHVWTLRPENRFLPRELRRGADPEARGDFAAEVAALAAEGVAGLITDAPDLAREVLLADAQ